MKAVYQLPQVPTAAYSAMTAMIAPESGTAEFEIYPNKMEKGNYYIFGAFGDKFEVGNRISHRKFDVEKIEAACTLCGIK